MYSFVLNGVEIDEPINFDRLIVRKTRSQLYFGKMFGVRTFVLGNNNLVFEQEWVYKLLTAIKDYKSLEAQIKFEILYCGKVCFVGYPDWQTLVFDEKRVSITFVDSYKTLNLASNITKKIEIEPSETITLYPVDLAGKVSHKIDNSLATVAQNGTGISLFHSVPFKLQSNISIAGTGQSVSNPNVSQPVYTNTSDKAVTVKVDLLVRVSAKSSTALMAYLCVSNDNALFKTASFNVGVAYSTSELSISLTTEVAPLKTLSVYIQEVFGSTNNFTFEYDIDGSYLLIEEKREKKNSVVSGEDLVELFKKFQLTNKVEIMPFSYFHVMATNGLNIRGVNSKLKLSFEELFKAANCLYNIAADFDEENNSLWIGTKAELIKQSVVTEIGLPDSLEVELNTDWLFDKAKVGYKTWQAESVLGNNEINALSQYEFGQSVIENELNLVSDFIASDYVIEETRLKQFETAKIKDWKFDNSLFWIANDTVRSWGNRQISPNKVLQKWSGFYGLNGKASFVSSEGKEDESMILAESAIFGIRKFKVTKSMEMYEFSKIGLGILKFQFCDEEIYGLIYDSSFSVKKNEQSEGEFFCWEIQKSVFLNN